MPEGLVCRAWGTESGLAQNSINGMRLTREGYLWLGTEAELARFDGVRFTVWGLQEGLPTTQVCALFGRSHGDLRIGTQSDGLTQMQDGRFGTHSVEKELPKMNVTALTEDADGRLWVGTFNGFARVAFRACAVGLRTA